MNYALKILNSVAVIRNYIPDMRIETLHFWLVSTQKINKNDSCLPWKTIVFMPFYPVKNDGFMVKNDDFSCLNCTGAGRVFSHILRAARQSD